MEKAVSDLQHEMASIRTGRASLGTLDHIRVDYYGTSQADASQRIYRPLVTMVLEEGVEPS